MIDREFKKEKVHPHEEFLKNQEMIERDYDYWRKINGLGDGSKMPQACIGSKAKWIDCPSCGKSHKKHILEKYKGVCYTCSL